MNITEKLFSMQYLSYRDFNSKLILQSKGKNYRC